MAKDHTLTGALRRIGLLWILSNARRFCCPKTQFGEMRVDSLVPFWLGV